MIKRGGLSLILVLVLNIAVRTNSFQDNYFNEVKQACSSQSSSVSFACFKHKLFLFLHRVLNPRRRNIQIGPLRFLTLPNQFQIRNSQESETREAPKSEGGRFFDYLKKEALTFLSTHGVQIPVPEWAPIFFVPTYQNQTGDSITEEGRGHSSGLKKYSLLFPLLAVFKFFAIKALLIPILLTVLGIKKFLVLSAMALPTLLQILKCRWGPGNPNGPLILGNVPAAITGAEPVITADYSHYSHPQRILSPYFNHHSQWDNPKSLERFD